MWDLVSRPGNRTTLQWKRCVLTLDCPGTSLRRSFHAQCYLGTLKATVTWVSAKKRHAHAACWMPCALTHHSGLVASSCSSRKTDRQGTGSPRRLASRSGRSGAWHWQRLLVYVAFTAVTSLTTEMQPCPRPRLKSPLQVISTNKN